MNKHLVRIISKLDIKNGLLIKGINLEGLRVLGSPEYFAKKYYDHGIDEVCYVDNVATLYGTNNLSRFIKKTSENNFIPLSVGGGIKKISDVERILKNGADKICINSAAVKNINIISQASKIYGSANICSLIEYVKYKKRFYITTSNGRDGHEINPIKWAKMVESHGAGEIFLTSVNHEGLRSGFDIETIRDVSRSVKIPVIAHGGAGNFQHILDVIKKTNVSGVAISSMFHYHYIKKFKVNSRIGNYNYLNSLKKNKSDKNLIMKLKKFLSINNIKIRS